jgi:hypothetical protein
VLNFVLFSRYRVKFCEPRLRRRRNSTISRLPIRKLGFDAVREVHFGFASATLKSLGNLSCYAGPWVDRHSAAEGLCGTTYEVMLAPSFEIDAINNLYGGWGGFFTLPFERGRSRGKSIARDQYKLAFGSESVINAWCCVEWKR